MLCWSGESIRNCSFEIRHFNLWTDPCREKHFVPNSIRVWRRLKLYMDKPFQVKYSVFNFIQVGWCLEDSERGYSILVLKLSGKNSSLASTCIGAPLILYALCCSVTARKPRRHQNPRPHGLNPRSLCCPRCILRPSPFGVA